MIDDLITKGVDEPYRMFTSRAEYRILLRQDDADLRLTPVGRELGLVDDFRWRVFQKKYARVDSLVESLEALSLKPSEVNLYLESVGSAPIETSKRAADLLVRPSVSLTGLLENVPRGTFPPDHPKETPAGEDILALRLPWSGREQPVEMAMDAAEIRDAAEVRIKYAGYIDRERKLAEKMLRLEALEIPEDFDFQKITSLSMECRIKLNRYRPRTIAQASRISGVSPADISVLLVYFGR